MFAIRLQLRADNNASDFCISSNINNSFGLTAGLTEQQYPACAKPSTLAARLLETSKHSNNNYMDEQIEIQKQFRQQQEKFILIKIKQ